MKVLLCAVVLCVFGTDRAALGPYDGGIPLAPASLWAMTDGDDDDDDEGGVTDHPDRLLIKGLRQLNASERRKDLDGVAYWVGQIGSLKTEKSVRALLQIGVKYPQDPVRTAVREALVISNSEEVQSFYRRELNAIHPKRAARIILIIEALEHMHGADAGLLAELLARVQESSILTTIVRALRSMPEPQAVEALVQFYKRVEQEQDRLWQETRATLLLLTGEDFLLASDWENWWAINKDTYKPPRKRSDKRRQKELTKVYRPKADLDLLPRLFGQEVASKRVVFVIDTSVSMAEEDELEGPESGGSDLKVRIKRAQRELIQVIYDLRPDVMFNIIAYNTDLKLWNDKQLVKATKSNKRKAQRFVESWKADGFTNTGVAVVRALEMPGLDTIILLSDGSPTYPEDGTLADIPPILEAIKKANRFKKVTIHTLGFEGVKESFMRAIARKHGGTYARIR